MTLSQAKQQTLQRHKEAFQRRYPRAVSEEILPDGRSLITVDVADLTPEEAGKLVNQYTHLVGKQSQVEFVLGIGSKLQFHV